MWLITSTGSILNADHIKKIDVYPQDAYNLKMGFVVSAVINIDSSKFGHDDIIPLRDAETEEEGYEQIVHIMDIVNSRRS